MKQTRVTTHQAWALSLSLLAFAGISFSAIGCGGEGQDSETAKAAAISLQQAMTDASRNIDSVSGTRSSLDRLSSVLKPSIAQTGDVIVTLTPKAGSQGVESDLLKAAQQQRTFLQYAADAADSSSWRVGKGNLSRANQSSRRAVDAYQGVAEEANDLAGLLPPSTAFNLGRLTSAVRAVTRGKPKKNDNNNGSNPSPAGGSCGNGVTVNSATSCSFALNVADEYRRTGSSVVYAPSPVTKQVYRMECTDGIPVVCRGGNNAQVTIR